MYIVNKTHSHARTPYTFIQIKHSYEFTDTHSHTNTGDTVGMKKKFTK